MESQSQNAEQEAPPAVKGRKVNLPLRITPEQHDALRRIAYERRVSIHSLMLEGVAEVLRRHGR